jgi:hypothetical protein
MGMSADAKLAWGVDLHTGPAGPVHESLTAIEDTLGQVLGERRDLTRTVSIEGYGYQFTGSVLVIKRTLTDVLDYGIGPVDRDKLSPPTRAEAAAVGAALDHLGYTGPRDIRLLLAAVCG